MDELIEKIKNNSEVQKFSELHLAYYKAILDVLAIIESYNPWHPWPAKKPNREQIRNHKHRLIVEHEDDYEIQVQQLDYDEETEVFHFRDGTIARVLRWTELPTPPEEDDDCN